MRGGERGIERRGRDNEREKEKREEEETREKGIKGEGG